LEMNTNFRSSPSFYKLTYWLWTLQILVK